MTGRSAGWLTVAWTGLACAVPAAGLAQPAPDPPADKSQYHLWNPTPRELLRDLDPAAADVTESPFSVDAGHVQVESALVGYTRDEAGGVASDEWLALDTAVRVGLTNDLNAELLFTAYRRIEGDPGGAPRTARDGFGDLTLRLKGNLWGNDPEPGQSTAGGWVAALRLPTGTEVSSDHVAGSLFLPVAWHAASRLNFQAMLQLDFAYDQAGNDHDVDLVHSAEAVVALSGRFGTYLEYLGRAAVEGGADYRAQASSGLTWRIGEDTAIDAGAAAGLNAAAPVVTATLTLTLRF